MSKQFVRLAADIVIANSTGRVLVQSNSLRC